MSGDRLITQFDRITSTEASATGRHIDDYATEFLFRPLGIRDLHWKKTPTEHPDTEGGLYLSAPDLERIGELYLRDDNRFQEFVYHGGGPGTQKRPKLLMATWADYKTMGPLLISTDHRGTADGNPLRLFFSDVSVKLTGSDSWVNAQ